MTQASDLPTTTSMLKQLLQERDNKADGTQLTPPQQQEVPLPCLPQPVRQMVNTTTQFMSKSSVTGNPPATEWATRCRFLWKQGFLVNHTPPTSQTASLPRLHHHHTPLTQHHHNQLTGATNDIDKGPVQGNLPWFTVTQEVANNQASKMTLLGSLLIPPYQSKWPNSYPTFLHQYDLRI